MGGLYLGKPLTQTGRVEFLQERPVSNNPWPTEFDSNQERLVYWEPPAEAWVDSVAGFEASDASKKYPLTFHWRRSRFATHTAYGIGCHWLDEIDGEPIVYLNPEDARERGLRDGEVVKVFNDRGYCVIRMHCDAGLRRRVIYSTQRAQGSLCGQYIEGNMGDMGSNIAHRFALNACFNECQVEVEKYEEA